MAKYKNSVELTILIIILYFDTTNSAIARVRTQKSNHHLSREGRSSDDFMPNKFTIDGYFNNEKSTSGKFQTYPSETNWIKCKITVETDIEKKDNLESLSLMNISNQRTLSATSCEITEESADSERSSCTCYFKNLNLKGEERLACCSDNHDPNCEQGYHFFITVLGNSKPTAMKPTVNKSTTASDYVRSTLSPSLHHMSSSHGPEEAAVLPGDLGFYTGTKTTVFTVVITACCLILGIPVVYVVYRRIKGSRRRERIPTMEI